MFEMLDDYMLQIIVVFTLIAVIPVTIMGYVIILEKRFSDTLLFVSLISNVIGMMLAWILWGIKSLVIS